MFQQLNRKHFNWSLFQSNRLLPDYIFLMVVVFISLVLYVTQLGFYSDDWAYLGTFSFLNHQSYLGFLQTIFFPQHHGPSPLQSSLMRPVQIVYLTGLYFIFGLHPLGYHLINALVLVLACLLFYITLRYLQFPRILSLVLALLYILSPNYSTDRFWIAAFQANLSMTMYFLSLYAGLKAVRTPTKNLVWKLVSIVSLLMSTLSYEVVLPLFLFNALLFYHPITWQTFKSFAKPKRHSTIFIIVYIISLGFVVVYKFLTTTRLTNGPFQHLIHYPGYVLFTIFAAIWVNFIDLGLKLPNILLKIVFDYPNFNVQITGIILGLLIFYYLYTFTIWSKNEIPKLTYFWKFMFVGLIIFLLGYAIFFVNNNINFAPTGIGNRVAIAAAIGTAMTLVGIVGLLSRVFFSDRGAKLFFCICIAILSSLYFVIDNTLASFWVAAYHEEEKILSKLHHQLPVITNNSTIILDGFCPYNGPAVVFESNWDLQGALKLMYHNSTLQADVVTPNLKINNDGLHTKIYDQYAFYPYKNLFIYNYKNNKVYPLINGKSTRRYFQNYDPDFSNNCPKGSAGYGVSVF